MSDAIGDTEEAQRAAVVAEARAWLRTPYHHEACVKGAGVDCANLLIGVYSAIGMIEHFTPDHYPPDWMHHRSAERFLGYVLERAHEVEAPLPGDIALWRFGRCFSHGAIVVEWPMVIHAYVGRLVTLEDAEKARWLSHIGERGPEHGGERPRRYFSLWNRAARNAE